MRSTSPIKRRQPLVRHGVYVLLAIGLALPFIMASLAEMIDLPVSVILFGQSVFAVIALTCYFDLLHQATNRIIPSEQELDDIQNALDALPEGIVLFNANGRVTFANNAYYRLYKFKNAAVVPGMSENDIIAVRQRSGLPVLKRTKNTKHLSGQAISDAQFWQAPEGQVIRAQAYGGEEGTFLVQHRDVSTDLDQRKKLEETRQFLNSIIERIPEAVAVKSADTLQYKLINNAFEKMMGQPRGAILGHTVADIHPGTAAEVITATDVRAINSGVDETTTRVLELGKNGCEPRTVRGQRIVLKDETGKAQYLLNVIHDLTEKQKIEQRLVRLATRDAISNLLNRSQFDIQIAEMNRRAESANKFAVVIIDLDGFKEVNDTYGHAGGDIVLKHVGSILSRFRKESCEAFRLGGDEFSLIVSDAKLIEGLPEFLESIMEQIEAPLEIAGQKVYVRCSIGFSLGDTNTSKCEAVVQEADIALYEAKREGKGCVSEFSPQMLAGKLRRKALEAELYEAIGTEQFVLHYQPIVTAQGEEICSVEALVRWNHPTRGFIGPDQFIPIAEDSGLIRKIGLDILFHACKAAVSWSPDIRISVNLSPIQFRDADLVDSITDILSQTSISADRLELEITEAALLRDTEKHLTALRALRNLGIRIVMDDFGTGYSSLTYLKRFPFDKIKIDKSYIDGLLQARDNSRQILKGIFALARELGIVTTAEGVEHQRQADFLRAEGCTQLQGYLYSRPVPPEQLRNFLHENVWTRSASKVKRALSA